MSTTTIPRVEVPHFRKQVEAIRGGTYTFQRALCDLLDYPVLQAETISIELVPSAHGKIESIRIHDDVSHGFENIHKAGSANPFNMGHEREGQSYDNETSQYGRGMSEAFIYTADRVDVYTHSIPENIDAAEAKYHVAFNFNEMVTCEAATESYEFSTYETIDAATFNQFHPFEFGSTIVLSNLRSNTDNTMDTTIEECEQIIVDTISNTYTTILAKNPHLKITVNNHPVTIDNVISTKIINDLQCNERLITYHVMVTVEQNAKKVDEIKAISYKRVGKSITYGKFNIETESLESQPTESADFVSAQSNIDAHELVFEATTTVDTPLSEHMFKNQIRMIRIGRNHGDIAPLTKCHNDGYNNHQFNCIRYDSKKLSPFIGITSDKHVQKRDNMLYKFLTEIHKKLTNDLNSRKMRKDTSSEESSITASRSSRRGRPPKNTISVQPVAEIAQTSSVIDVPATPQSNDGVIDAINNITASPLVDVIEETHNNLTSPQNDVITTGEEDTPEIQIVNRSARENRYVKAPDARIMVDGLSEFAHNTPRIRITDDLLEIISYIASERGGHLYLLEILRNEYRRCDDNQNVMGGAKLAEVYAKYINEDDLFVNSESSTV
jgi:hypothetical protein